MFLFFTDCVNCAHIILFMCPIFHVSHSRHCYNGIVHKRRKKWKVVLMTRHGKTAHLHMAMSMLLSYIYFFIILHYSWTTVVVVIHLQSLHKKERTIPYFQLTLQWEKRKECRVSFFPQQRHTRRICKTRLVLLLRNWLLALRGWDGWTVQLEGTCWVHHPESWIHGPARFHIVEILPSRFVQYASTFLLLLDIRSMITSASITIIYFS